MATTPNAHSRPTSKWAKILYRPVGIASGVLGGLVAGIIFKQVWKLAGPQGQDDAPDALDTDISFTEILIAALLQGALFALVKALVDRGGARAFQKVTGQWPGN